MSLTRLIPLGVATVLTLAACARVTPQTEAAPETAPPAAIAASPAVDPAPAVATPAASAASAGSTMSTADGDRLAGAAGTVGGRDLATSDPRAVLTEMIFFDYDQSELRSEARATLDAKLAFLQSNPSVRIRIAGHTDERGSDEYNLALGLRRAAAAKRYLVELGIAENRMTVVSFGEERPLNADPTDAAWAQNRRDEFEIIASGAAPVPR